MIDAVVRTLSSLSQLEGFVLVAMLVSVGVYLYGSSKNKNIASELYAVLKPILATNFSKVGNWSSDSPADFLLYATGRKFVSGMTATLSLESRQDLLTHFVPMGGNRKDTLTLEFHDLETSETHMMGAVSRRGLWKETLEQMPLLKNCSKLQREPWNSLPFVTSADSKEISDLLGKAADANSVEDLETLTVQEGKVVATLRVGGDAKKTEQLVRSVFALVDNLSSVRLSEKSREASKELREVRETEEQRRDRLEKLKAEKYEAMSKEAREKHDKKIEKKEMMKQARQMRR